MFMWFEGYEQSANSLSGLGLGLGLGLLGHSITRINILSLPFKGVDIKLGFGHIAHSTQFLPSHHCIGSSRTPSLDLCRINT